MKHTQTTNHANTQPNPPKQSFKVSSVAPYLSGQPPREQSVTAVAPSLAGVAVVCPDGLGRFRLVCLARVAESVDAADLRSVALMGVWVRVPRRALNPWRRTLLQRAKRGVHHGSYMSRPSQGSPNNRSRVRSPWWRMVSTPQKRKRVHADEHKM
jgi:hypothetical protein